MNAQQTPIAGSRPPALLADATWYGTLSAVRDLGAHGVSVTLASDALVAPARWSRHVRRTVACPRTKTARAFVDWLLRFGQSEPRHVLYPTSDESAWLVSAHAEELSRWFHLYSPPIASFVRLLDKLQLVDAARSAGLEAPETRVAESEAEVERLGRELGFPLYIKPRTQVLANGMSKGARVEQSKDLLTTWRKFRDTAHFDSYIRDRMPNVGSPVIQTCTDGSERIYTVDGFVDETGELYASRACIKLLQRPRGSGPGIVFVHADLDPAIDEGLRRLFKATGFHGVFDAEFLEQNGRKLLIDLNPRFYNHMAFEVNRGLHLPWLAYLAAIGAKDELCAAVRAARTDRSDPHAYVHRLPTSLMLAMQTLSGGMTAAERRQWRDLISERGVTDPAVEFDDRAPGFVELLMEVGEFFRHPRSFVRKLGARGPSERKTQ